MKRKEILAKHKIIHLKEETILKRKLKEIS